MNAWCGIFKGGVAKKKKEESMRGYRCLAKIFVTLQEKGEARAIKKEHTRGDSTTTNSQRRLGMAELSFFLLCFRLLLLTYLLSDVFSAFCYINIINTRCTPQIACI